MRLIAPRYAPSADLDARSSGAGRSPIRRQVVHRTPVAPPRGRAWAHPETTASTSGGSPPRTGSQPARMGAARGAPARVRTGVLVDLDADLAATLRRPRPAPLRRRRGRRPPTSIALITHGVGRRRGPFPIRTVHVGTAGGPQDESVYISTTASRRRGAASSLRRRPDRRAAPRAGLGSARARRLRPGDARRFLAASPRLEAAPALCPVTDLRAAREAGGDVLATLRPSTRRKVRRGLRGLGDDRDGMGRVIRTRARPPRRAHGSVRSAGGASLPGAFASDRFTAFHRDLGPNLFHAAPSRCSGYAPRRDRRLPVQLHRGRACPLLPERAVATVDSEIRPGLIAHGLCMQACFEHGLREYDFLAGDARYKEALHGPPELIRRGTGRRLAHM